MTAADWVQWGGGFFVAWFCLVNGAYLVLNLVAFVHIPRRLDAIAFDTARRNFWSAAPPVSILMPAHDEAGTIVGAVRSMLQLEYAEVEVIVVNDGSRDDTLAVLAQAFALAPDDTPVRRGPATAAVRGVWRSATFPALRVIDKDNGGKADALNAGLRHARHLLVCAVDADSVLARDGLARLVSPFLDDPLTIAAGGSVRPANGITVHDGHVERVGLPRTWLGRVQVVEYLRAFLFGRVGWAPLNAVLIVSGAFGLFRRDALLAVGGWRTGTVGEDMELVMRLHRTHRATGRPYRIAFVPDPVLWTEAPERWSVLRRQRSRWQRGLGECLAAHRALLADRRAGAAGWLAYPFFLVCEWLSPLVEVIAYLLLALGWTVGAIDGVAFAAFLLLALGTGVLLSTSALLLEELHFRTHAQRGDFVRLLAAVVIENLGYRQLTAWWRCRAMLSAALGRRAHWGRMTRSAQWQRNR